ncbi:hypothetical protein FFK22_017285 [Mycobacterium sp. KBS0706]|nr:hypothetical protein FFK22_017285 [Mycobacterium sp. KBS0706]
MRPDQPPGRVQGRGCGRRPQGGDLPVPAGAELLSGRSSSAGAAGRAGSRGSGRDDANHLGRAGAALHRSARSGGAAAGPDRGDGPGILGARSPGRAPCEGGVDRGSVGRHLHPVRRGPGGRRTAAAARAVV